MSDIENSLLIRTYRGERCASIPIWFMRQAGRYLPEYRELRKKHSMLEMIKTPKLAAEVTLQPLRRFAFDGSIIFADILNPLIGMGMELEFIEGAGPKIFNLLKNAEDVSCLRVPDPDSNIPYTLEAINFVATEISRKGIPLLGFCGAPFTLAAYMLSSNPSERVQDVTNFIKREAGAWAALQEKLAELVGTHLVAQVNAGAAAAQIFDTWVGHLNREDFVSFVKPYLVKTVAYYKNNCTAPLVYFGRSTEHLFTEIADLNVDVIGVDFNTELATAARLIGRPVTLQGNLSPEVLAGPIEQLDAEVYRVLESGKSAHAHAFNLGHGILPHTPPENVACVVEQVKNYSLVNR